MIDIINIEEIVNNRPKIYFISIKHNPAFKSSKSAINVDKIVVRDEITTYEIKRFLFWRKKKKVIVFGNKKIKISDLRLGDIICVLEQNYPDRWIGEENYLYALETEGEQNE